MTGSPIETIEVKRWSDFRSWIDTDRQICPVYWRGQRGPDWPLASQFERLILHWSGGSRPGAAHRYPYDGRFERGGQKIWEPGFYTGIRDRYLDAFKQSASGLRGPTPAVLDTDQWWALGRHHGLITPLLDWTESPYIAAFFPLVDLYREMGGGSGSLVFGGKAIAVFRLFHNEQLEGDGLRVVRPVVEELDRMHGQRGLFTWLSSETYFELEGFLSHMGRGNLLTKFVISNQAVLDGLRDLRSHGIDHRLLFPDLGGAAEHANSRWNWF